MRIFHVPRSTWHLKEARWAPCGRGCENRKAEVASCLTTLTVKKDCERSWCSGLGRTTHYPIRFFTTFPPYRPYLREVENSFGNNKCPNFANGGRKKRMIYGYSYRHMPFASKPFSFNNETRLMPRSRWDASTASWYIDYKEILIEGKNFLTSLNQPICRCCAFVLGVIVSGVRH